MAHPESIRLSTTSPAICVGEQTTLSDGTPVRRFKRYGAKVGATYRKKGWKTPLVVTEDRAKWWLSQFDAMKSNGVSLKVTKDHENWKKAENTMGDGVSIEREGDWLAIIHDVRGAENIRIAEANKDVSIEIEPYLPDGRGNLYRDVISCISYTPIPVVNDQPIAASLDDTAYELSLGEPEMQNLYLAIATLVGVKPEEVTVETAQKYIDDHAAKFTAQKLSLDAAEKSVTELTAKLATTETEVRKLSTKHEPNKHAAKLAVTKISHSSRLSVAGQKELTQLLVGDPDKKEFSPLMLSLSDDDASVSLVEKVVDIIDKHVPVTTEPGTGTQTFSRETPDADKPKADEKKPNPWLAPVTK